LLNGWSAILGCAPSLRLLSRILRLSAWRSGRVKAAGLHEEDDGGGLENSGHFKWHLGRAHEPPGCARSHGGATAEAALAGFTCILNRVHMPMRETLTIREKRCRVTKA
jgi:hypothetical protein